jgi:hypothetical protein
MIIGFVNVINHIFNNRELAIIVWTIIFTLWILNYKEIRKSIFRFLETLFQDSILIIILSNVLYLFIWIRVFYYYNLWDITLLKDTLYWYFGVALVLFLDINKAIAEEDYFKKLIVDTFKIVILIQYISNLHTFSFIVEFIMFPFLFFFSLTNGFTERKDEYIAVRVFTQVLLVIYGIIVSAFSIYHLWVDFQKDIVIDRLKMILLSPTLTIIYLPFIYLMAIFFAYEEFLKTKKWILKDNIETYKFLKWEVLKNCKFSLSKLRKVKRGLHVYVSIEFEEIRQSINSLIKSG